jgi:hypothetical protein
MPESKRQILVPISTGELVDKITILRIKTREIKDAAKLRNVRAELDALETVCREHAIDPSDDLSQELEAVNHALWVIEDDIREKERAKAFDARFIELARAVYVTNDRRFQVKARINERYGSVLKEEKSYEEY